MSGHCPACEGTGLRHFLTGLRVPVHSCLLVATEHEARTFPRGALSLACCSACGFVFNPDFDEAHNNYSADYEETQGFSPHFRDFSRSLAKRWVDRYDLHGKKVVEIGCGKGEFLVDLVEAGAGHGVGIDPGVHPERIDGEVADRLTWVPGFFPRDWPELDTDAVVCRHTLEHIAPAREFMRQVRAAIGDRTGTAVLFELPDVLRVLREGAFWDVYYEHCSYFSAGSLARLFRATGFEVFDLSLGYDDQYLLIEARPTSVPAPGAPLALEDDLDALRRGVETFAATYGSVISHWAAEIDAVASAGGRTVIWGSGSKGVAFLAALGTRAAAIDAAVDINPYKHGKYMAGSGHRIISPEQLVERSPELVIAMNPTYRPEIAADLARLGIDARLEAL